MLSIQIFFWLSTCVSAGAAIRVLTAARLPRWLKPPTATCGSERKKIWFASMACFRTFSQAVPATLPIGAVQALAADAQGNLWILLQKPKIPRYRDGKFEVGHELAAF